MQIPTRNISKRFSRTKNFYYKYQSITTPSNNSTFLSFWKTQLLIQCVHETAAFLDISISVNSIAWNV